MDRLRDADTTLVVPNPLDIPPPGSLNDKPGFFIDCDLEAGFLGTPFRAYWANMITECIRNAILKAGITPEYTDWHQLGLAIEKIADQIARTLINILVPPMIKTAVDAIEFVQDGGNVTGTIKGGKFTLNAPVPPPPTGGGDGPAIPDGVVAIGSGTSIRPAQAGTSAATWNGKQLGVNDGSIGANGGDGLFVVYGGTGNLSFQTVFESSGPQAGAAGKFFIRCANLVPAPGDGGDLAFSVDMLGNVAAKNTSITGADYAEWFETLDGQPIEPGVSVVLDGGKVRAATEADDPQEIIGVTRPAGAPGVIGNAAEYTWAGLYVSDAFGQPILEEAHLEETDPETGAVTLVPVLTPKRNSAYDPARPYIPRSQRPEWVLVGLLGQVPMLTGQPRGDRWRVMRPVSDAVTLVYIR
jgi:hypothetical protein